MANTGTYRWIAIDDILEKKPEENDTCVICMECPNEPDWHLQLAHWYFKGAKLNIVDNLGKDHTFNIDRDGFYLIDETSSTPRVFMAHGVKYWTVLQKPDIKPDDILTIE